MQANRTVNSRLGRTATAGASGEGRAGTVRAVPDDESRTAKLLVAGHGLRFAAVSRTVVLGRPSSVVATSAVVALPSGKSAR